MAGTVGITVEVGCFVGTAVAVGIGLGVAVGIRLGVGGGMSVAVGVGRNEAGFSLATAPTVACTRACTVASMFGAEAAGDCVAHAVAQSPKTRTQRILRFTTCPFRVSNPKDRLQRC